VEICGNCLDDDGDGLVDFEDADCCSSTSGALLDLKKGLLRPGDGAVAKVKLKAKTSASGLPASTTSTQDLSLQIRTESGEVLCARVAAAEMVRKKRALKFRDKSGSVGFAEGLTKVTIKEKKKDGSGKLNAGGKKVELTVPAAGPLTVTLALRDPATAEAGNYCASGTFTFRETKKGLRFP
jgi:hypothetical protein